MRIPRFHLAVWVWLCVFTMFGWIAGGPEVQACSICRCGDAIFNAFGKAAYVSPGLRAALDVDRFDKDEGDPTVESESLIENRIAILGSYTTERVALSVRVPYSFRELTERVAGEEPEKVQSDGFSDPEVYGQVMLWGSEMSALGRRSTLALTAGVKLPWGENEVQSEGERLDEHAQSGTGSTDVFASVGYLFLIDPNSSLFVSAGHRHTGENDHGYRYGSAFLANLAYEHKMASRLDAMVELNFRDAAKDRIDDEGTLNQNTGGSLLYLTPKLGVELGGEIVLRGAVQIPTLSDLNGHQEERAVVSVGMTRSF